MASINKIISNGFLLLTLTLLIKGQSNIKQASSNPWVKLSYDGQVAKEKPLPPKLDSVTNGSPIVGSAAGLQKTNQAFVAVNLPSTPPSSILTATRKPSYADLLSGKSTAENIQPSPSTTTQKSVNKLSPERINAALSEDDQLREFSENLIKKDTNNVAKFVALNLQSKTTSFNKNDLAPQSLLQINSTVFNVGTISKLLLLYNNYEIDANINEHITGQERTEEEELLNAILSSAPMQYARNFLILKGKLSKDVKDFKELLRQMWFATYSRGEGKIGSSGFEHVFLAEIKKGTISGLHNWIYFDSAEKAGKANYLGYMKRIDLGDKGSIVKYHFTLNNIDKPVGSMFVGTSPELEMALYSVCYILRRDRECPLSMAGNRFIIRTYNYRYRSKDMIGSAFPEI